MFDEMSSSIREETVRMLFSYRVRKEEDIKRTATKTNYVTSGGSEPEKKKPVVKGQKVGRNDPCPCGSGKKYKKCCGRE
jgi:preprotein translocase subunit SecA